MPVSIFLSGDSITDAISKGTRDQGYLYQLQRELRAADQTYNFNAQSQPLQLDALRQNIETTRLQNEITASTSASYIDATNAGNIYTGAKSRARLPYVDAVAGLEAATAQQQFELNRIQLASSTIGLQENVARLQTVPSQIARKEGVDAGNFGIAGIDASKIPGLDRGPSQRLAGTAESIANKYVDPKTGAVNSGAVGAQSAPTYSPPPGVNSAVYNTLRSEVADYETKGPIYRSNARVYGAEAAEAMGSARRETLASLEQVSLENDTQRRGAYDSRVAYEKKDIESLRVQRENEQLKSEIAQLKSGTVATPSAQPVLGVRNYAPATARPDPLAAPAPVAPQTTSSDPVAAVEGQQFQPDEESFFAPATRKAQIIRVDLDNPQVYNLQEAVLVEDRVNGGIDLAYANVQPAPATVQSYDVSDPSSPALPIIAGDPGTYFQGMIRQESRGKQFNASGGTLTSSAGALGAAQIMPGTGPEAARLAGVKYDPDRLRNDIQYNVTLGQAYYRQQYKAFGSLQLAAAAYNAGPGAVRKAIRRAGDPSKGETSMASFLRYLPKETQDYVRITSGHFAKARGAGK